MQELAENGKTIGKNWQNMPIKIEIREIIMCD